MLTGAEIFFSAGYQNQCRPVGEEMPLQMLGLLNNNP
jgi:hypothetical protein